jgi:hypothetical protein
MNKLSRRAVLGTVALSCARAVAREKAAAFGLIGDRFHNSDYIRTGLNRTIGKDIGVSIDFTDETRLLTSETLKGYKLLIIHRDGMIWPDGYPEGRGGRRGGDQAVAPPIVSDPPLPLMNGKAAFWMQPEQGKAVREFVEKGGSSLFLHNVTHVGLTNPDFRHVLGAAYAGHPHSKSK